MIRECNGTDPNLIGPTGAPGCACGARFDDVVWMVTYPHAPVGPKPSEAELRELSERLGLQVVLDEDMPRDMIRFEPARLVSLVKAEPPPWVVIRHEPTMAMCLTEETIRVLTWPTATCPR